ncbi:MAG: trypsin-like peptidase domain-containing protein [Peptococcaceae bacterium]|nr:trypsin-like peptidase domain-containing protein [Peptococcaceae bacterium]
MNRRNVLKLGAVFFAGALVVLLMINAFPGLGRALAGARTVTAGLAGSQTPTATTAAVVQSSIPTGVFGPETIADIVAKASPAVVKVTSMVTSQVANPFVNDPFFQQFFGNQFSSPQTQTQEMLGSGFIFRPDGYILTNDHVINGANSVTVTLAGQDKTYPATVVGTDYNLDLAVLKINAGSNLPTLALGNSNQARVGDWVIAIGNPYGLDHTVTVGVLSAKGRPITAGNRTYSNLMQTDAAINPGNSGGPLLNLSGQVIGINTAMDQQAQGIGFAIPTSTVSSVLTNLINHTPTSYLGVSVETVPRYVADQLNLPSGQGTLVAAVEPNSPAATAGLQQGDVIVSFNGQTVEGPDGLVAQVRGSSPGSRATLAIYRNGRKITVTVTIGSNNG